MADGQPVPDSAMDTGSEDGEPGGTTDETPLTDEERAMLDRLRHPTGTTPEGSASEGPRPPEESPAAGAAAEDDAPLAGLDPPGGAGDDDDPLAPIFREPPPPQG